MSEVGARCHILDAVTIGSWDNVPLHAKVTYVLESRRSSLK